MLCLQWNFFLDGSNILLNACAKLQYFLQTAKFFRRFLLRQRFSGAYIYGLLTKFVFLCLQMMTQSVKLSSVIVRFTHK